MNLYYFGSDDSWGNLCQKGFNRRNTNILKAFVGNDKIETVYNVKRVPKNKIITLIRKRFIDQKIQDVYFCSLLPDKYFTKTNKIIAKAIFILQTHKLANSNDLIWCYWPGGFIQAEYLNPKGRWFFDADHNIIEDPNIDSDQFEQQRKLLIKIAFSPKIEAIVSSTRSMLLWFEKINNQKHLIRLRNGIDLNRFNSLKETKVDGRTIVIGYCGTLSRWIKWNWLLKLIEDLPDYTFKFIGNAYKSDNYLALKSKKNVELLGFKGAHETPSLIKDFDVAIGLYQEHEALDVDSMKLYEYLAANVPIVVNRFHSFLEEDFEQQLLIADTYNDFIQLIQQAISKKKEKNLSAHAFLTSATWEKRVDNFICEYANRK